MVPSGRNIPLVPRAPDSPPDRLERVALALLIAVVAATRLIGWFDDPDLWTDEAMLAVNVVRVPFAGLLSVLPYFEQTAPLGFLFLTKALGILTGYSSMGLRAGIVLAGWLGAYWLYLATALLSDRKTAIAAVALVVLAPLGVVHGIEFKHYMMEFSCSAWVLFLAARAIRQDLGTSSLLHFALGFCAALPFSNTLSVVLVAVGACMGYHALVIARPRPAKLAALGTALAICAVASLAMYLLVTKPLTALQMAGYAHLYAAGFPPGSAFSLEALAWTVRRVLAMTAGLIGGKHAAWIGLLALVILGALVAVRRLPAVAVGALALAATVIVLVGLHLLPITSSDRHFLFAAPFVGVLGGTGVRTLQRLTAARLPLPWSGGVLLALVAILAGRAVPQSLHLEKQETSSLVELSAKSAPGTPLWVYFTGQPSIEYGGAGEQPGYLGAVDHRSGVPGWIWRIRWDKDRYLAETDALLAAQARVHLLFSHVQPAEMRGIVARLSGTHDCALEGSDVGAWLWLCAQTGRNDRPGHPLVDPLAPSGVLTQASR